MPKTNAARRLYHAPEAVPVRARLVKNDYPRAIDRYIDYFGGLVSRAAAEDVCGERLLETVTESNRATA